MSQRLLEMGCYEISLGDTIGTGAAGTTHRLLDTVLKSIPADKLAVHFHDTYGQVLVLQSTRISAQCSSCFWACCITMRASMQSSSTVRGLGSCF